MDWSKGYTSQYICSIINRESWKESGEYEIIGGSIKRDGSTRLLESADFTITQSVEESYIRIYLIAEQNGESVKVPLFTGIATTPGRRLDGTHEENTMECYSILKVADDILLPVGWYAASGANTGTLIASLLKSIPSTVTIYPGAPVLTEAIVAGSDTSNMAMARLIADAAGWEIRLNGMGDVEYAPKPSETVVTFDGVDNDVITPSVSDDQDMFNIPNVLRVTNDRASVTVRDDSPMSQFSTVSRGREVWKTEAGNANAGETLANYAMRRLKELQAPARKLSYARRYNPDIIPNSLVSIIYPAQKISGVYRVLSQSISLGSGTFTQEEVIDEL